MIRTVQRIQYMIRYSVPYQMTRTVRRTVSSDRDPFRRIRHRSSRRGAATRPRPGPTRKGGRRPCQQPKTPNTPSSTRRTPRRRERPPGASSPARRTTCRSGRSPSSLGEAVKPADAELVKRTIREEDWKRAKAAAGEATKRAARLRRQLVELRNANVNREGERVSKELTAAAKRSGSRVLGPLSRPAGAGNLTTSLDAGQADRVPARFSSRR